LRIADLGTGSGALLLALLSELPRAWGVGTDFSEDAIAIAAANARRFNLTSRAMFAVSNFGRALDGSFDLIVSNPPYIASGAIESLAREVREYDPLAALDGGEDGLAGYRAIAGDARRLLRPRGAIILELGAGQAESVCDILSDERLLISTPAKPDLAGIPRALVANRP
jgi:release factor glutamine methyltransferase